MKFAFDFLPIVLFVIAFKMYDFFIATAVIMVVTFIQMLISYLVKRKIESMQLITLVLILVLGGATLFSQDEMFLKWKPTIVNWLFAVILLGAQWFTDKPILQRMMGKEIELPKVMWNKLSLRWALFFIAMGVINLYVAYSFSTEIWVNFKIFGLLGLTLIFAVVQAFQMARYIQKNGEGSIGTTEHS